MNTYILAGCVKTSSIHLFFKCGYTSSNVARIDSVLNLDIYSKLIIKKACKSQNTLFARSHSS